MARKLNAAGKLEGFIRDFTFSELSVEKPNSFCRIDVTTGPAPVGALKVGQDAPAAKEAPAIESSPAQSETPIQAEK